MPSIPGLFKHKEESFRKLEIRLDAPAVYLTPNQDANQRCSVTGRVVLMNHDAVSIKAVKISLTGTRKVSWDINRYTGQYVQTKERLLFKEIFLRPPSNTKHADRVEAGNHIWPFQIDFDARPLETIEGLLDVYVRYYLESTLITTGYTTKNLHAMRNLRVLRTMQLDASDFALFEQIESGTFDNKLEYAVHAPPKQHYWGKPLMIKFNLLPLTKGLKVENLGIKLLEKMNLMTITSSCKLYNDEERIVSEVEADILNQISLNLGSNGELRDDYEFCVLMPLPKSLKYCRQSVNQEHIQIHHSLDIKLVLSTATDDSKKLSLSFPIELSLPSGISFNENSTLSFHPLNSISSLDSVISDTDFAPPPFGEHYKDFLYPADMTMYVESYNRSNEEHMSMSLGFSGPSRNDSLASLPDLNIPVGATHLWQGNSEIAILPCRQIFSPFYDFMRKKQEINATNPTPVSAGETPSYDHAIRMPEVYTDIDGSLPSYVVACREENS